MSIVGCVPFKDQKERRLIYHELRSEYGKGLKIKVSDNLIEYEYYAPEVKDDLRFN